MTLAAIAELVDSLELAPDRGDLAAAFGVRDRLDAKIALAVAEAEMAGVPELDGCLSTQSWLRQHSGRDPKSAAKTTIAGRKLRVLPELQAAVLDGSLSGGQLDIILANVALRHLCLFQLHEARLVPLLIPLTVDETRAAMEDWKRHADALNPGRLEPDGTVEVTYPDGRHDTSRPRGPVPQRLWPRPDGS